MGKSTGSLGFLCAEGKVIKGKKMPGHMGVEQRVIKNLDIVKVDQEGPIILVKGSVPGYDGSLVFVRKHA
jgi:large subunit ribosomal protein L3